MQKNGVIPDHALLKLMSAGALPKNLKKHLQPSSVDLPVGTKLCEVAAIPAMGTLQGGFRYQHFIKNFGRNCFSLDQHSVCLTPGLVYIVELPGSYKLPKDIFGYANPKSSTGRIDVFSTVVAEGAESFNSVPAGFQGKLYALLIPQSFPIQIQAGDCLLQLRLFQNQRQFLNLADQAKEQANYQLVQVPNPRFTDDGVVLRLNLKTKPSNLIAQLTGKPIDLSQFNANPRGYFQEKPLFKETLFLEPNQFLLASTLEEVRVPPHLCAEMLAFREEYGELRTHYAGFIDPGFGYGKAGEAPNSILVCEIRNIGKAPIMLAHGQPICLLRYEKLTQPAEHYYSDQALNKQSNYQGQQGIKLAKYFSPWKEK